MAEPNRQISFRAAVFKEAGEWVAHCLDLDIVSTGPTPEAAMDDLAEAIGTQFWYAREHDNYQYLFRPAPPEVWQKLGEILRGPYRTIMRSIDDGSKEETRLEAQLAA